MADKKISQLTGATTPLAGTEVLPIVQSGTTVKVSVADLTAGRSVSATNISAGLGAVGTPAYTFAGDLNTGMWSPASDVVAFSTAGSERMCIVSSGNVGVGTSSPADILDVRNDTSNTRLRISTSDNGNVFYAGWRTGASFIAAAGYNSPVLAFDVGGSERMRIDGSGNLNITNGNLVLGTAGKGIDFSANANAPGMTSELLNWYEEGDWTPTQGAGLTVVGSYSSFGKYTRIGKQVTVVGEILGSTSVAVSSGGVLCAGLPFATPGGSAAVFAGGLSNANVNATSLVIGSGTTLYASAAIAATTRLYFSATYLTA